MFKVELYNKSNALQETVSLMYLEEYMDIINWKRDSAIIDIGCGDGSLTSKIAQKIIPTCMTMTGCDINKDMVRFANKYYSSERVNFTTLDIGGELPVHLREHFHHAITFFAIHWCRNQETVFQNIYSLLRHDGNCFVVVVEKSSLYDAFRTLAKAEKWKPWVTNADQYISPYHDSQEPLTEIRRILQKTGFTVIKLEHKLIHYKYESLEQLKDGIMSLVPFKIPKELHDDFFIDICLEMHINDTKKYNFKKSTNDLVFNVQALALYVEKSNNG